ncbi:MAG: S9 family peptidase [Planctomycetota bacterium]
MAVAIFATAISAPAQEFERMTPELLWELDRVSSPSLNPAGTHLLYHVRSYELAENRGTTQVFVRELETSQVRQLTASGSNFNGAWSPDGTQVAFLSTRSGSAQIHVMDLDGGEARQVTDHGGGVSNMAWSPDGKHFSFTCEVQFERPAEDLMADLPFAEARIYDDLMVRHWDSWNEHSFSHLFVVSSEGGEARDLMEGLRIDTPLKPFGGGEQITWVPDSSGLVLTAKAVNEPQRSTNSELWFLPLESSALVNLTAGMDGYDIEPQFSPDGTMLAWVSMERDGYESDQNRLFVMDWDSRTKRRVDDWDLTVAEFTWSPDGRWIYLAADTQGTHQIFRVPSVGGTPKPVTSGRSHFSSPVLTNDGSSMFALRMSTERPYEIVEIPIVEDRAAYPETGVVVQGGALRQITNVNGEHYANLRLPTVEQEFFEATDGEQIHCWVIYPPDFDPSKKYPMLTYCQGGPQSQVGQWFSFRWNFHLMAAQGYIVLAINRRGLPGFGTEWNEQISGDWGGQAMQDYLSATDAMFEKPFVDRQRTGAIGASFGGYSTYWLMGHDQEDRFCTMISHCGVFNLESMYLSTEELFFVNWDMGGPFWASPELKELYDRFSPHRYVENWDTPLLVIHGQKDFRVPLEQGLGAFTAAQEMGVPSRFVYFPEESHWVLSPQNGVLWHRLFFDWLDRYCKPGE